MTLDDFGKRKTDFGQSDAPVPNGMRLVTVSIKGEPWRFEIRPDEDPARAAAAIEAAEDLWAQVMNAIHGFAFTEGE